MERNGENVLILTADELDVVKLTVMAQDDGAGAISSFLGTTRDTFEAKKVVSLEYEAYNDMAIDAMQLICTKIRSRWGDEIKTIVIAHKLGSCPVGHTSVFIGISSKHRTESLRAVEFAINDLKASVPIWKKEVYGDEVEGQTQTLSTTYHNNSAWKKNKEFQPRVPLEILSEALNKNKISAEKNQKNKYVENDKANVEAIMLEKEKKMLRKSACGSIAGEGGEAILKELNLVFQQYLSSKEVENIDIDEIGILMLPDEERTLVCMENKLGIPIGCMKPLFAYSVQRLQFLQEKYLSITSSNGVISHTELVGDENLEDELMYATRAILIVRGDMPVALNMRKRLLLALFSIKVPKKVSKIVEMFKNLRKILEREISLLNALFTLHPKSPSAWSHRRWVLSYRFHVDELLRSFDKKSRPFAELVSENKTVDLAQKINSSCGWNFDSSSSENAKVQLTQAQLDIELNLCTLVNGRYPKNYYGWTHRIWLLRHMSNIASSEKMNLYSRLLYKEYEMCETWLLRNTSDHCAVNYYIRVLEARLEISSSSEKFRELSQHFDVSSKLVCERPGSETLWCLRRGLVTLLEREIIQAFHNSDFTEKTNEYDVSEKSEKDLNLSVNGPISPLHRNFGEDLYENGGGFTFGMTTSKDLKNLSLVLQEFAAAEMCLVRSCMQNIKAWNFQKQRDYAMKYAAHFLYILKNRIIPVFSSEISGSFPDQVSESLLQISQKLKAEDTFERGWEFLGTGNHFF